MAAARSRPDSLWRTATPKDLAGGGPRARPGAPMHRTFHLYGGKPPPMGLPREAWREPMVARGKGAAASPNLSYAHPGPTRP